MGRRSEQTFFQIKHTDGQQAHEKMLNISNNQRNSNKNKYITSIRMAVLKKKTNKKCC